MLNKYILFLAFALLTVGSVHAQRALPQVPNLQPRPYQKQTAIFRESFVPEIENPNVFQTPAKDRSTEQEVGITRWDAHGYGCVPSRAYYKLNGDPVATWTHATDQSNIFPERGTAYSSRSGSTWSPVASRIETVRTGFPSSSILSDGTEVVVSHTTGFSPFRLMFLRRPAGTAAWTESFLDLPLGVGCLWPHLIVGGADGMTVHVIAITTPVGNGGMVYQGINGHVLYWRSTDGGLTWDKKFVKIPGLDSGQYTAIGADEYAIDANGEIVAVSVFSAWNDLLVFKSFDNGETWETITALDFPDALENYEGAAGQTYSADDVGDPDPNAPDPLAVFTNDGWGNILVDNNGEVHLFYGRMYVIDNDPAAGTSYYPGINGLAHWKESFGADTYQIIGAALDYDDDGVLNISSINEIAPYFGSLSTQPSSGIDAEGNIYVGYSAVHELYRSTGEQLFRHIYVVASKNNGDDWGDPLDLIDEPFISEPELIPFVESVFPMLPRHLGSNDIGVFYQQDYEPGISTLGETHPYADNFMLWLDVPRSAIPGLVGTQSAKQPNIEMSILPNPSSNVAQMWAVLAGTGDVLVEVFDMMGQRVYQNTLPAAEGRQVLNMPVQLMVSGTYWVRIVQGQQFGLVKWVIAK